MTWKLTLKHESAARDGKGEHVITLQQGDDGDSYVYPSTDGPDEVDYYCSQDCQLNNTIPLADLEKFIDFARLVQETNK
jgi:hypothetical protein